VPSNEYLYAQGAGFKGDHPVDTANIVREIDAGIARLTSARRILTAGNSINQGGRRAAATTVTRRAGSKSGSRLTAAGRKKLSEMMKKRWAERRKAAAKAK
jgi:hypothetical protein